MPFSCFRVPPTHYHEPSNPWHEPIDYVSVNRLRKHDQSTRAPDCLVHEERLEAPGVAIRRGEELDTGTNQLRTSAVYQRAVFVRTFIKTPLEPYYTPQMHARNSPNTNLRRSVSFSVDHMRLHLSYLATSKFYRPHVHGHSFASG